MSTKHFKIGIDCDDVLVAAADQAIIMYNATYGTQITRDNWYNFESLKTWGIESVPEIVKRVALIFDLPEFETVLPLEGAFEVLTELKQAGHDLIVLTGRPGSLRQATLTLLDKYYPGLFDDSTLYMSDYFAHDGVSVTKRDIAHQLELTHFIDDQRDHANDFAEGGVTALLFGDNYPWNQGQLHKDVIRVRNWQEVKEFFDAQ